MHFTNSITAAILAFSTVSVIAAPLPQLAGEGSLCNSLLSGTDNAVGYGVENAEDNLAGVVSSVTRRQLAGEGAACDSILTDTDNGVGHGIENAEDNLASTISGGSASTGSTGGSGGSSPPPPPPPPAKGPKKGPKARRQLDKIAKGAQTLSNALHTGALTSSTTNTLVNLDGTLTGGAANLGAKIGSIEESTLEGAGNAVPKLRRQLDKIAHGAQTLSNVAHTGQATSRITNALVNVDGTLTSGAANIGADVGQTEEATLEDIGNAV